MQSLPPTCTCLYLVLLPLDGTNVTCYSLAEARCPRLALGRYHVREIAARRRSEKFIRSPVAVTTSSSTWVEYGQLDVTAVITNCELNSACRRTHLPTPLEIEDLITCHSHRRQPLHHRYTSFATGIFVF